MKQIIRLVNNNLDLIYNSSKKIAQDWDKNTIPLTTLKVIIEKAKPKVSDDKEINEFRKQYNITLDTLFSELSEIAAKMESKSIRIDTIKFAITMIKDTFKKSLYI